MTNLSIQDYLLDQNVDTTKKHIVVNNDNLEKQQISTTDQNIELQKKSLSNQKIQTVIFIFSLFLEVLPIASLAVCNIEFDKNVQVQSVTIELSDGQLNQK